MFDGNIQKKSGCENRIFPFSNLWVVAGILTDYPIQTTGMNRQFFSLPSMI